MSPRTSISGPGCRRECCARAFDLRAWAPWQQQLADDELMSMTEHPDNIKVFVVGGPGKHSCVIPSWGMTKSVTVAFDG